MQEHQSPVKTVLVVEDYADSRSVMARLLEMSGYKVLEAADGREAVSVVERECPDVVLMDLQMPVLDGFTATSIIRRIEGTCHVPIIAVSAQPEEEYAGAARLVSCDHYVAKPADFDRLLELVRQCTEVGGAKVYNAAPNPTAIKQHSV